MKRLLSTPIHHARSFHHGRPPSTGYSYRSRFPALDLVVPGSSFPVDDPRLAADFGMPNSIIGPSDSLSFPCSLVRLSYCVERAKVYLVRMPVTHISLDATPVTPLNVRLGRNVKVCAVSGAVSCIRLTPYHVASLLSVMDPPARVSRDLPTIAPSSWDERPCSFVRHDDTVAGVTLHSRQFQLAAVSSSLPDGMKCLKLSGSVIDDTLLFWHGWRAVEEFPQLLLRPFGLPESVDQVPRVRTWSDIEFSPEQVQKLEGFLSRCLREGVGWGEYGGPPYASANNRSGTQWKPARDGSLLEAARHIVTHR